jgi:hypothetical protein
MLHGAGVLVLVFLGVLAASAISTATAGCAGAGSFCGLGSCCRLYG